MCATKLMVSALLFSVIRAEDGPRLAGSGGNVTVVEGRDATLSCTVHRLGTYKVAWLRVDTQTILTIGGHVITKNHRVAVTRPDAETWALTLRASRPADAGPYMCQVNTEPMITQTHQLQVFVPPDIVDAGSSSEVMVREGENVTLHCAASGTPQPNILWRRENAASIRMDGKTVSKWNGVWLNLTAVGRESNGAFLCIATNGVPPSVSKRITLHVLCKPIARMAHTMVGGYVGEAVTLQCLIEANPVPVVYWTHYEENKLHNGSKYQAHIESQGYRHSATLLIRNVSRDDIGAYRCRAENAMGAAQDDVTLYTLVTTTTTSLATTQSPSTTLESTTESISPYPIDQEHDFGDQDYVVVVQSRHQMQSHVGPTS